MGRLLFSPSAVGAGDSVLIATDDAGAEPADIVSAGGGPAVTGGVLHATGDGSLPRFLGPADGTETLYLLGLDYRGVVTGDPVELTGVDLGLVADPPGGSSPVAVFAEATVTLAAADLTGDAAELTLGDATDGWDLTAPTTLKPPQPGRYHVSLTAYGNGTLDAPAELKISHSGASTGPAAAVPTGATGIYAGSVAGDVSIADEATQGIQILAGYSDSAPTTGGVDIQVYVHRIGDLA